jgi:hypothetical protein
MKAAAETPRREGAVQGGAQGPDGAVEVLPRRLWWLGIAFVVWCLALVVLYALHAIGCAFGWSAASLRWTLVLVFLAHLAAIGWIWRRFARSQPTPPTGRTAAFVHDAIVWTAIAAFASTVLALGPPLLLTACI